MPLDRAALRQAVRARNIQRLEAILATVKDHGMSEDLAKEVREARRLLDILRRLNTIKTSLQELKQAMLAGLVNENSPHKIMVAVMTAVMVVLGVPEDRLQDWSTVQKELGTTARKNYAFIKRMVNMGSASIQVSHAKRAQEMLSRFNMDMDRVHSISEPLGLFYSWLLTITDEVISIAEAGSDD